MVRPWKVSAIGTGFVTVALILAACSAPASPTAVPKPVAPAATTAPASAPPATTAPAPAAPATTAPAAAATTAPAAATTAPAAAATTAPAAATTAPAVKPADPTKPAAPVTAAAPAAAGPAKKLSFIGVQSDDQQFALTAVLKEYQKTHPEIDVAFELLPFAQLFPKIQANAAAKAPTDIILADGPNMWSFAYNGIVSPMDEYFDQDYIKKTWGPTSLLTSTYKGKFYAPPQMESCSVMWFNQDMTDKAGIKPPQQLAESWTTDKALDAWQKTNSPPQVYGIRWGQGAAPGQDYEAGILRRAAGAKGSPANKGLADDGLTISGYFDHPDAVKGHQFFADLYSKHKVSAVEGIPDAWVNGRAAFFVSPDNAMGTYKRLGTTFKFGATGLPYFQGGSQVCHTDSWHYALGANSVNKKEAAEFIKYLSGPIGSKVFYDRFGQLPAVTELQNTLPDYKEYPRTVVREMFQQAGQPRIVTVGFTEYNGLMQEFVGNLVAGSNLDVQALATALAKRNDSLTAKYKDWQTKP